MAVSEDGLTEAVCLPDKRFVWAVQWHPEFSFRVNEDSRKIFKACGCVLKEKPSPKGEGGAERRMRGKFAIIVHKWVVVGRPPLISHLR